MINIGHVTKYFGACLALHDVSCHIDRGEIVGFLGQNGAGKTTLMRILTSYLPATAGTVSIGGCDVSKRSMAVRKQIGYLPETPPLYPQMTVDGYLMFAARLKDVPARRQRAQVDRVLDECDLRGVRTSTIGVLSKGYKQRVGIAQAIIHDPEVLIFDEPTSGLDPIQILHVRKLINDLRSHRTVIVSTHILSEIEQIAQRVLVIKSGKIVVDALLGDLLKEQGVRRRVVLRVRGDQQRIERALQGSENVEQVQTVSFDGQVHAMTVTVTQTTGHCNELCAQVLQAGGQILELTEHTASLEDVFLALHATSSTETS